MIQKHKKKCKSYVVKTKFNQFGLTREVRRYIFLPSAVSRSLLNVITATWKYSKKHYKINMTHCPDCNRLLHKTLRPRLVDSGHRVLRKQCPK